MKQYLNDLKYILDNGEERPNRTGTGTIGVFGMQTRYDLNEGFPAVTTKKLGWDSVKAELLWFIEGSGDERRLCEIRHGTRDKSKRTIWTPNANSDYWHNSEYYKNLTGRVDEGELGRVYGVQWRKWRSPIINGVLVQGATETDQLKKLIEGIKNDPYSRRHILTAWNPGELDQMALPPCHMFAQFYVSNDRKLSCQMYQRSQDAFLGAPFNIASYALFTHMIAQVCGLADGEFVYTVGDAHIYLNHIDQVKEQLSRTPYDLPTLWLNPDITNIDDFKMSDISLDSYISHEAISAPMAV